ncbi:hypothetical protein H0901_15925 [Microcystis aeruginosa BLCCF158]|uniref:Uncharacterized protein n=1 Tax=Microcystis aeruginosa BLCC-F158 TaxID=2755316 RepID=A0A841V392_MICAE|nr:hypothetical protein [Microcystis aeruginosa]MBC1196698.1 hypothetical protein [Microcystis aeruginosa BLCC-F158]
MRKGKRQEATGGINNQYLVNTLKISHYRPQFSQFLEKLISFHAKSGY